MSLWAIARAGLRVASYSGEPCNLAINTVPMPTIKNANPKPIHAPYIAFFDLQNKTKWIGLMGGGEC